MPVPLRACLLLFPLLLLNAQTTATVSDLASALKGSWAGTLEYRDFSEPAGSTKRVKLPTWLTIEPTPAGLAFHYTYDDGPGKTVTETETIQIDAATATYRIAGKDTYRITGLETLHSGRGTLTLTGPGKENDKPVEVRTTIRIGRNILEMQRETAAPGEPLVFRHAYTMVRTEQPIN